MPAIFPALIVLVSILSLFGQDEQSGTPTFDQAEWVLPADAWEAVGPALESILTAPAGLGLVIGLAIALWLASGYAKAFGRAMTTIHAVPEGRSAIMLNLQIYLQTGLFLVLGTVGLMIFVLSGPGGRGRRQRNRAGLGGRVH